jgi:UDP-N-acetylmuramoyl-tripeptide--D-alanyl-D-alanine ligase
MAEAMKTRTLEWVSAALSEAEAGEAGLLMDADLGGRENARWTGAAVDSRAECTGRLFFALRGENVDGHRFIEDAHAAGSAAAVVEDAAVCGSLKRKGIPYFLVSDTQRSLQELARAYRDRLDVRVVAITGSAGKTTTKEYVRRVMRAKYRTFANPGNFNSMIGVPLTVLETEFDNEYLVSEVGANQEGEVEFLAALLRPNIGVITNVGDAHVGMFGSVGKIADAKAGLLDHLDPKGYAVLPRDDAFFGFFEERVEARVVTFGRSDAADFVLANVRSAGTGIAFDVNDAAVELNAVGEYNALNACAAFAVGDVCGVDHSTIRGALAEVTPMTGRGRTHRIGGVTVIDESYNASPSSTRGSVVMLEGLDASRRLAVLGDMKELGEFSEDCHRALGEQLAKADLDAIFWLGESGGAVREGFDKSGGIAAFHRCGELTELVQAVGADVRTGDAVLVKASRAIGLDRLVARLLEVLDEKAKG